MSDFTAALHHNPHPKPVRKPPQRTLDLADVILDALGFIRKSRTLTKSDCKLVA